MLVLILIAYMNYYVYVVVCIGDDGVLIALYMLLSFLDVALLLLSWLGWYR